MKETVKDIMNTKKDHKSMREIKMIDTKSDKHKTESDDTDASGSTYILSVSYRYHESKQSTEQTN